MRRPAFFVQIIILLVASFLMSGTALAAVDEEYVAVEPRGLPDAQELLQKVIESLPNVAVKINAQILSKTRRGKIDRKLNTEMVLDWYGHPPYVRYTIRDRFGDLLDDLTITWPGTAKQNLHYICGDSPDETSVENLYERIQGTDISWIDLTLSYLWWPDGKTVGMEPVKGRTCYIVDLSSPDETGEYAGVRLWIDAKINILLQAAAYDDSGQLIKLLEVKSFKKIREVWIIKDLDIQSFPMRHKTVLRVRGAAQLNPEDKAKTEATASND